MATKLTANNTGQRANLPCTLIGHWLVTILSHSVGCGMIFSRNQQVVDEAAQLKTGTVQ